MNIQYNKQKLETMLEDVFTLIKTPISIFDKDFNFVTTYKKGVMTDYCTLIRSTTQGQNACASSDRTACERCKKTGESFSYQCHGLVGETVTPITFENQVIGYIIFGQYRVGDKQDEVLSYAEKNGLDSETLLRYYKDLTVLDQKQITAVCNILKNCTLGFYLSDAVSVSPDGVVDKIEKFIDENLTEKLTAEVLCSQFLLNKKQLYAIFKERFDLSVKDFITTKRINKAKHLLKNGYSVSAVAERCGFSDYNNFIQRFKKEVGTTPLKYKKYAINHNIFE